jgi:hypothetical protein
MGGARSADGGAERLKQGFGGKTEGKDRLGETGVDGKIILRLIFRKWCLGVRTGSIWFSTGTGGGHL